VISLASDQGFPLYVAAGTVINGWALAAGGKVGEGIQQIRSGLDGYAATGAQMWSPYFLGLLAEACGFGQHATVGLAHIADALDRVKRTSIRWIEADLYRVKGDLLLRLPEPRTQEAETCFFQALTIAKEQGASLWELRAAVSLASLWHRDGKQAAACNLLGPLCERSVRGVRTSDLDAAEALIDELSRS
jgi:predicted ATPase